MKEKKSFTITLDDKLYEELMKTCNEESRSKSSMISIIIRDYVSKKQSKES